jgi:hypothetical protein
MDVKLVWQKDRSFRRSAPFAVLLAAALTGSGACVGEGPEDEPTDVETRAFSIGSCAEASLDAAISHPSGVGPQNEVSVTSPTTYNNCYKGYVVDIFHNEAALGLPTIGWQKVITVKWAGPIPITQSGCEAISGAAILYDYDDFENPPWVYPSRQDVVGRWVRPPLANAFCSTPTITYSISGNLASPIMHRVAVTMRTAANATTKVRTTVKSTF